MKSQTDHEDFAVCLCVYLVRLPRAVHSYSLRLDLQEASTPPAKPRRALLKNELANVISSILHEDSRHVIRSQGEKENTLRALHYHIWLDNESSLGSGTSY